MDLKPLGVKRWSRINRAHAPDSGNVRRALKVVEWEVFFREVIKAVRFDRNPQVASIEKVQWNHS